MFQFLTAQNNIFSDITIDSSLFIVVLGWLFYILDLIKPFLVAFVLALSLHIIYVLYKTNRLKKEFSIYIDSIFEDNEDEEASKEKLLANWLLIEKKFESSIESENKLAVIEADKFIDDILKKMLPSLASEEMSKRLKKISRSLVPSIDKIWYAHKIRNKIVHDPNFELTKEHLQRILDAYNSFLRDVGLLQ